MRFFAWVAAAPFLLSYIKYTGKMLFFEGFVQPLSPCKTIATYATCREKGGGQGERILLSYKVSVVPYFIICLPIQRENEVPVP